LELSHYCDVAERAARRAGAILREMAGKFSVREKGHGDLVTSADLAAQEAIQQSLLAEFPDHAFLGEESREAPDPAAEFRWIVDPLDGTTNYVHGVDFYAVSIGLERRGELIAGVIFEPAAERCFRATYGGGAFLDGKPIRVSEIVELRRALLLTGFPPNLRGRDDLWALFQEFCSESHSVRRLGSAALDLANVASGRFEGFYSTNLHCWDAAAGVLLVREAGGQVTKLDGSPYSLYTADMLATNGLVHQAMVEVAQRMRR
jgi:myo-inositol-1(or 4)-monophosphatase